MNLKNKIIVISGVTKGIGQALVEEFLPYNPRFVFLVRTPTERSIIKKNYGGHKYFVCDFKTITRTVRVAEQISSAVDHVDVLINVAAVGIYSPFSKVSLMDWQQSFAVNVTSPFILTRGLLKRLECSRGSIVINIGSGSGVGPDRNKSTYCATKFAFRGWTLSLAEEYKNKFPRFCLVTLGRTLTSFGGRSIALKQQESNRGISYFSPVDVAKRIANLLLSDTQIVELSLFPPAMHDTTK